MIFKKDLIIYFSFGLILISSLTGCITFKKAKNEWPLPPEPISNPVKFQPTFRGYFITNKDATNLVNNIEDQKAYIEKLKLLINEMNQYYGK